MKYLTGVLILALLYSCEKTDFSPPPYQPVQVPATISNHLDSVNKYKNGTWNWVESRTYSSYGWVYETPDAAGYRVSLQLSADTARFFRDGTASGTFRYRILAEREISEHPDDHQTVLATYDLQSGQLQEYYRVMASSNHLQLLQSYRSDIDPDITFTRME